MSITYSGATVSIVNGYKLYTFTNSGTIKFPSSTTAQVLIVGGGGAGGCKPSDAANAGGGGGGGGVGVGSLTFTADASYTITVGGGGSNTNIDNYNINDNNGTRGNGGNSSIILTGNISETAYGGGGGGYFDSNPASLGNNGGSGGGSTQNQNGGKSSATRGAGTLLTYYGNNGGSSTTSGGGSAGGGGGATGAGGDGGTGYGGEGGKGYSWFVTNNVYGSGGGGGTMAAFFTAGSASGGGGTGGPYGYAGTVSTGGGGGGSSNSNAYGGNGGSGIVIIAFPIKVTKTFDYTIYTFRTSDTITFPSNTTAQVLIVGGGGGGGNGSSANYEGGGGGGGGGVGVGTLTFTAGTSYAIIIGAGGRGGNSASGDSNRSLNGTDTSISGPGISETAYGGGKGGDNYYLNTGSTGGSGGGGTGFAGTNNGGSATKGAGSLTYYGNSGGNAVGGSSAGGGGALTAGISSTFGSGGVGGNGYYWNVNEGVYGSGGGGGMSGTNQSNSSTISGSGSGGGGYGGGAINGAGSIYEATAGIANTGGGGGGSYGGSGTGGTGGSGVVIIAVPTRPWGAYIAGYGLNTTTSLYDITGNGRHAIIGGSGLTTTSGSGNGATASIPYITGTTATNITWPTGSIPSTFTLCSITRYNGGNKARILSSTTKNFAHGHFETSAGFAYYENYVTGNQGYNSNSTNWVVMCGTNGTDDTTNANPNNILANGVGIGVLKGGSGNAQLSINNDTTAASGGSYQYSEFAFNMVLIFDYALTNDELSTISSNMMSYLTTGNPAYFIQSTILPIPRPWGAYIASNSTTSGVVDYTGQGRHASFGGSIDYNAATHQSAKQTIPIIYGSDTVLGSITWPAGSIPSTYTICSISRYHLTARRGRIFDAAGSRANWLHGHWGGKIGVAFYNDWKTDVGLPNERLSGVDSVEWIIMCSTNGTNNITPYNILANGIGVGIFNGGSSSNNWQLTINAGNQSSGEWSGFAFNQVIIWDVALTNTQLKYMSDILQNYVLSGIMTYPWLAQPSYTFNSSIGLDTNQLIMYYPFDTNALNYATGTGVTSGTSTGSPTFPTTYTKLTTGSLYLNGSTQYFEIPTYTLTANGFTAAVWFKNNTSPIASQDWERIFDFGLGEANSNIILGFQYNSVSYASKDLRFVTYSSGGVTKINIFSGYKLFDKNWHHYCVTVNKEFYLTIYVDGLYSTGGQFRRTDFPIGTTLTNTFLGKSNWALDPSINGYYNSFIIYNRCLEPSELPPLLLIKNATLNGYFNSFRTPNDVTGITGNVTSITNNSYLTNLSLMRVIPGWSFTGVCQEVLIGAGNNILSSASALLLKSSQHYFIFVQFYQQIRTQTMQQVIRFTPGTYTLYYTVAGKPGYYNSNNTITSSITGLLSESTPTLSNTSWTTVSQTFTVATEQLQALTFVFEMPIYISGYTAIILRSVYIVKNTNYFSNATDITLYGTVPVIQSSTNGLTAPITNSIVGVSYLQNGVQEVLKNSPYYMHGARNNSGFKVNGTDIGEYFQQTLPFDGSYGYCFEVNYSIGKMLSDILTTDAKIIWAENNVNAQASTTAAIAYWLYYTFYYGGPANTGTFYAEVDDFAYLYFNGFGLGTITYTNTFGSSTISNYSYSINIVNGLNYIRVACYNNEGFAGFYAALKDSGGNVVAVTNSNWTWSIVPSTYATTSSYYNIIGSLPYVVNLTMSGTAYYSQSPINIANYITGAPSGTTYSPSQITAVGTYTFSNISVTLPSGYLAGTYSGSIVVNAAIINVTGLTYSNGGETSQFPIVSGYNVMYIKSGTGTLKFLGYTIKNIFVVGGGAGGSSGGSAYPGLGGGVSNNNVNFSGNNTFNISVGNGGAGGANGLVNPGSTGTQSTCVCAPLSVNYVGSGGTVATSNTGSVKGTQHSYNSLYYGGSGGSGAYRNIVITQGAPLGGGGGGGGIGYYASQSNGNGSPGGVGGGISVSLTGGAFGAGSVNTSVNASPGTSSPYGGGGGGGGAYDSSFVSNGGTGGAGSGTATGGGGSAGTGGIRGGGGGGGNGGVNTGGGGGGGANAVSDSSFGGGGTGGSGIVIIVYI